MAELKDLIAKFTDNKKIISWIPAQHIITEGYLCLTTEGIIFLYEFLSKISAKKIPYSEIREASFFDFFISPSVIIVLQNEKLTFEVNKADAAGFMEQLNSITRKLEASPSALSPENFSMKENEAPELPVIDLSDAEIVAEQESAEPSVIELSDVAFIPLPLSVKRRK